MLLFLVTGILNFTSFYIPVEAGDIFFLLVYANRKVQETGLGLDMIDTYQVLAYADDLN